MTRVEAERRRPARRRATRQGAPGPVRRAGAPEPLYAMHVSRHLRALALDGRGEDARGRNLLALHVLETSYEHAWLRYTPSRGGVRWLLMLLDLVGTRSGLAPARRVDLTFAQFLDLLRARDLDHLAEVSDLVIAKQLAECLELTMPVARSVLGNLSVFALLWHLGFRPDHARGGRFEKHTQGKIIRRKITDTLDTLWADALRAVAAEDGAVEAHHVLAGLPPSATVVARQIDGALHRVDESLDAFPFAVVYALATDAKRAGRLWEPAPRYVEGVAFGRDDFETAVGRALQGARSRKRRYRRSVALAELGLSAFFPETIAVVDGWLDACPCSEFCLAPGASGHAGGDGWFSYAQDQAPLIEATQWRVYEHISRSLRET